MSDNFDKRVQDNEKGAMGEYLKERARAWTERTKGRKDK